MTLRVGAFQAEVSNTGRASILADRLDGAPGPGRARIKKDPRKEAHCPRGPDMAAPPSRGAESREPRGVPGLSRESRLHTRDGCPRLAELVGQEVVFWSGKDWARGSVVEGARPEPLRRIRLTDGRSLTGTLEQPWLALGPRAIAELPATEVRPDTTGAPHLLPDPPGGAMVPHAYEMGYGFGAKSVSHQLRSDEGLCPRVFSMSPGSLRDFAAGWLDAQNGSLSGTSAAVREVQILLQRIGVGSTVRVTRGLTPSLALPRAAAELIPNPRQRPREFRGDAAGGRAGLGVAYVSAIEDLRVCGRPCALRSGEVGTAVVDGVLARI